MADPVEEAKAPETTPINEHIVPNQALIEQVIDRRLAAHSEFEKASKKTSSRTSAADEKKAADSK